MSAQMTALQEREARAREWFADHVVVDHQTQMIGRREVELLEWRKPGTYCYAVTYLRVGDQLTVCGDLGEASYGWGHAPPKTLAWIAGCDVSYFASKCTASAYGRGFRSWDPSEAARQIEFRFQELDENEGECRQEKCTACDGRGGPEDDVSNECPTCDGWGIIEVPLPHPARAKFGEADGHQSLGSKEEWLAWLDQHGYDVFGDDFWEWCAGIGEVIDGCCVAHLVGLKMAMEQLGVPDRKAEVSHA